LAEYALILALMSLVLVGALGALSDSVAGFFSDVVSQLGDL
jgi:Flp pilus assembly pilin Flp